MAVNPKPPSQLNAEEAVELLPKQDVISVIQRHAMPGKLDEQHKWHRDFAADKIRHKGAHKAWNAPSEKHTIFFTDENNDQFFLEANQPSE